MMTRWSDEHTLSEDTSISLLARAQRGDGVAAEALMARYLRRLQRWASGRMPARARTLLDTDDLVQDALLGTLRHIDHFTPRHDGALMAYLREAVWNRIRMELRRKRVVLDAASDPDSHPSSDPTPFEALVGRLRAERYEQALATLDEDDRAAIIGRFEMGYSYAALARALERPSPDAARKVVERAVRRLAVTLETHER